MTTTRKKAEAPPAAAERPNHACFAVKDRDDRWERVTPEAAAAAALAYDAAAEFHSDDAGFVLYRSPILGMAVGDTVACCTGAHHVAAACRKLGCKPPTQVARRLADAEARASGTAAVPAAGQDEAGREPAGRSRSMKGKTSGKTIGKHWGELFAQNEKRAKGDKWTDEALVKLAEKEFPDSAGKATTNRPRMYRSHYNNGTFTFLKEGSAQKRGLPHSYEYDKDGGRIEPGTRRGAAAKTHLNGKAPSRQAAANKKALDAAEKKGRAAMAARGKPAGSPKKSAKRRVVRRRK